MWPPDVVRTTARWVLGCVRLCPLLNILKHDTDQAVHSCEKVASDAQGIRIKGPLDGRETII